MDKQRIPKLKNQFLAPNYCLLHQPCSSKVLIYNPFISYFYNVFLILPKFFIKRELNQHLNFEFPML
ncbi:unnamed protein product [Blepharisma stoltei]|uniref:Uncharacterized protein n=1 Tax=Blepharisma stoltei TaxID=1481888 RepID=A0AAU9KDL5_9CILI|nr:unnamed protein product [Blepharisma stoltei]